jgi:hypothetical protein
MTTIEQEQSNNRLPPVSNSEAVIRHLRENLVSGKHWYIALLEAVKIWTDEEEDIQGRNFRYLIENEAFDFTLLAERLCEAADGLIPEHEKDALLLQNKPPLELAPEEFKELIGPAKYHRFLNYYYGITVEEALKQAVREEVRKERRSNGLGYSQAKEDEEASCRVYGDTEASLLKQFRRENNRRAIGNSDLTEMKEFTYWCFKYRVKTSEKARVASDTQKALDWLRKNRFRLDGQ